MSLPEVIRRVEMVEKHCNNEIAKVKLRDVLFLLKQVDSLTEKQ